MSELEYGLVLFAFVGFIGYLGYRGIQIVKIIREKQRNVQGGAGIQ